MLNFGLTIYPLGNDDRNSLLRNVLKGRVFRLAVVVEEAVILGAMSEFETFNSKPFCSITKTVFLIGDFSAVE